jgi:two-component system response regulator RegX3
VSRVLVVEDETAIRESVAYALAREGFDVDEAENGQQALDRARRTDYDVVVLDLMLPRRSGLDVCRILRSESGVPIIMLTAKSSETDRIVGLELGADDYVVKPFSMAELTSRVRALLRRRELDRAETAAVRRIGGLLLDAARHEVTVEGTVVRLTLSEFRLLYFLAAAPGRVFSRRQIMEHLWSSSFVGDQRACDIHVSNIRRKIERDTSAPMRLVTVRGLGYRLDPA